MENKTEYTDKSPIDHKFCGGDKKIILGEKDYWKMNMSEIVTEIYGE